MNGNENKFNYHLFSGRLISVICIIVMIVTGGCLGNEKISGHDAVRIALNDSQVRNLITDHEFDVVDVGPASISTGDSMPEEMYAVTINVQNNTPERILVFVNFEGQVVRIDSPYTAKAPDALIKNVNESLPPGSVFVSDQ